MGDRCWSAGVDRGEGAAPTGEGHSKLLRRESIKRIVQPPVKPKSLVAHALDVRFGTGHDADHAGDQDKGVLVQQISAKFLHACTERARSESPSRLQ